MTVYKPIKRLATAAAEIAVHMARGRPIVARSVVDNGKIEVPSILCEIIAVERTNLVETVIRDGFHTYEDVFRSVPAAQRPPRP
jgi:D-xylose transport system substrate-binding protein